MKIKLTNKRINVGIKRIFNLLNDFSQNDILSVQKNQCDKLNYL